MSVVRERKHSVIKRISLLITAALMAAMMMVATAAPAFAVSPSERNCENQEGATPDSFNRERGEVSCTITEEGKNKNFTREEETTGQGNIGNKTEGPTETCTGTGSEKCPPGQFKD